MAVFYSGKDPDDALIIEKELSISLPVGAQVVNVFQVTGSVRILDQWARITEVTRMDDLTAVYATWYNGTSAVDLTSNGIVLSNLGVGTYFTKDKLSTQTYSLIPGTTGGMIETVADRNAGRPFTLAQKNGANCYIQLRATAGTATQVFKMFLHFKYELNDGGSRLDLLI
jgi:hypothetical protein